MSKACEHAVEYVYHYLDDEMTVFRKQRISWHLRRCGACCGAFDFEKKLRAVIRDRGREQPPEELFDGLRALIQRERESDTGD
jgi:mycothiol system anti-sigma-R factor